MITIKLEKSPNRPPTAIEGFVDNQQIVKVSDVISGKWHTATSTCLPSNINAAREYIDCMVQVFEKLDEVLAGQTNSTQQHIDLSTKE